MDCSPPGSSVHGTSQARILEGLPFPSPGNLPDLGIEPTSLALAGRFFVTELPGKPGLDAEETLKNLLLTDPGHMCRFGRNVEGLDLILPGCSLDTIVPVPGSLGGKCWR